MVPYVLLPQGRGFVIHVSRLATHTADMLGNPAVSVLVVAPPGSAATPQEIPRASVKGRARQFLAGSLDYAEAQTAYLSRFPQSADMFGFADFSLFVIEVRSARFVEGFARATSLTAEEFSFVMDAKN